MHVEQLSQASLALGCIPACALMELHGPRFEQDQDVIKHARCTVDCTRLTFHTLQLEEDFIKANPDWVKELQIMVDGKVKAEIQALSSFGFQYLTHVYLPLKLQEGDWI